MRKSDRLLIVLDQMELYELPKGPLRDVELSYAQYAVLAGVAEQPGCTLTGLAEQLGLSAPTVSVTIRKLEEGDWVVRKPDPKDARITHLYLSKKANRVMLDMQMQHRKMAERFLGRLSAREQDQLLKLLEKAIH